MIKYSLLVLWFLILIISISGEEKSNPTTKGLYFPASNTKTLIYETSFGESSTKYTYDSGLVLSSNEGEKFKYRQKLLITDDGVYVKETYQYLKIFLFIKKEATYSYNKPLMRLPFPLTCGTEWNWTGIEYCNDDSSNISVSSVLGIKSIIRNLQLTF